MRGRWGYVVGPVLPYITGGLAYGRVVSTITSNGVHFNDAGATVAYGSSASFSDWLLGYAVGAGFDWAVSSDWRFRAEYLFVSLQGGDHTVTGVAGVSALSNEMDVHLAKFAVIRRFAPLP